MRVLWRQTIFVVATLLAVGGRAHAQEVGVLVGLAERGSQYGKPDHFTTLWISVDSGGAARAHRYHDLLVPAENALRRVWVDRRCTHAYGDDGQLHCEDVLRVTTSRAAARAVRSSSADACTVDQLTITFVSPSVVSFTKDGARSECYKRSFSDVSVVTTLR